MKKLSKPCKLLPKRRNFAKSGHTVCLGDAERIRENFPSLFLLSSQDPFEAPTHFIFCLDNRFQSPVHPSTPLYNQQNKKQPDFLMNRSRSNSKIFLSVVVELSRLSFLVISNCFNVFFKKSGPFPATFYLFSSIQLMVNK